MINQLIFINVQHINVAVTPTCTNLISVDEVCLQQTEDQTTYPKSLSPQLENSYLVAGEEAHSLHLMEDGVVGAIDGVPAVDISHCQKGI